MTTYDAETGAPGPDGMTDIHSHVLPGLDDGPGSPAAALRMCRACVRAGVGTVVATPHVGVPQFHVGTEDVRRAAAQLQAACREEGLGLRVLPGAEVRLEPRVLELLDRGCLPTLAGAGRHLLIELPAGMVPGLDHLRFQLAVRRITPVLAHPERCLPLRRRPGRLADMVEAGWLVQVTAGALTGEYGPDARKAAARFLRRDLVHVVATDAHEPDALERGRLGAALRRLRSLVGARRAERLLRTNPDAVVAGRPVGTDARAGVR